MEPKEIVIDDIYPEFKGEIHFKLYTDYGLTILDNMEFIVKGFETEIEDKTDSNGEFKHGPVWFDDYELYVGDAAFIIPAMIIDDDPYEITIPYEMLQDENNVWDGPSDEEIYGEESEE